MEDQDEEETKKSKNTLKNIETRKTGKRRWEIGMKREPREKWAR